MYQKPAIAAPSQTPAADPLGGTPWTQARTVAAPGTRPVPATARNPPAANGATQQLSAPDGPIARWLILAP